MSRLRSAVRLAVLCAIACGSDDPTVHEQILLNDTLTIAPGSSHEVKFSVDLTEITDVTVNGYIQSNENVRVLLLSETQFDQWTENQEFTALYDSGEKRLVEFLIPVNQSGRYILLISNAHDAVNDRQIQAIVSVRFQEP